MHYRNFFTRSFWPQVKCSTCGCQVSAELQVPACSTQEQYLDLLPWAHMNDDIGGGAIYFSSVQIIKQLKGAIFFIVFQTIKALVTPPNTPCIQLP